MWWIVLAVSASQILLLGYAATSDVTTRLIPDCVSLGLATAGIFAGILDSHLVSSLIMAAVLFLILLLVHGRGWIGGGDVKLLVALAIGLSVPQLMHLLLIISIAGLVLAIIRLGMRRLPYPHLPTGASYLRRVYAIERWRALRNAPLPYAVAIACSGIITILTKLGA